MNHLNVPPKVKMGSNSIFKPRRWVEAGGAQPASPPKLVNFELFTHNAGTSFFICTASFHTLLEGGLV